jgi:hypothetical protein
VGTITAVGGYVPEQFVIVQKVLVILPFGGGYLEYVAAIGEITVK